MCPGGREPELAEFLFTSSYTEPPRSTGPYYASLERSFQGDHNAIEIARNGSVFKEKLWGQVAPSFLSRPPGSLNVDERLPRTLPWTLTKGERIIPFNIDVEIQIKPGHDKATSCFSYISPSTLWISVKFGTYGKVFSRRIQRLLLQEDWRRTR